MDWNKVSFIFFMLMSLTTSVGFVYEPDETMISIALIVNLISTFSKIGSKHTHSVSLLASSFVADLHLIPAFISIVYYENTFAAIAFCIGAIVANLYSMVSALVESSKNKYDDEY